MQSHGVHAQYSLFERTCGIYFSEVDIIAERYQVCSPWPWCSNVQLLSYCTMYHCSLAGTWYTTYTRVPYYITSYQRSLVLESLEYTVIDMRIQDTVTIELSSNIMAGRIITGELYMH